MSTKQSFTIVGEHWINGEQPRTFNYLFEYESSPEIDSKNKALSRLLFQPWRMLSSGKHLGVKGLIRLLVLLSVFGILNLYFIAESWYETLFKEDVISRNIVFASLTVLLGLVMFIVVIYLCYRFLVTEVLHVMYSNNVDFFKSFSGLIVDKAKVVIQLNSNVSDDEWMKNLDFTEELKSKSIGLNTGLRKVAVFVASRVPMMDTLNMLHSELKNDNREVVQDHLFQRMDAFLKDNVFESNSTNWVYLLLPVNLILQIILLAGIS